MIKYKNVRKVRFSCAYLFRIFINGKYFLVQDEQGRNTFQPVGGVYKYTDKNVLETIHATQCMRFGTNTDLDCDLRLVVPRNRISKFKKWYFSEKGRECQTNLYREFKEEILDRIDSIDPSVFEQIEYRCCGTHEEVARMGENDLQIRIADIVELVPTPQQAKVFLSLMQHESPCYHFATKEEIYELGRVSGNQVQTISGHTYKILCEEEKNLKKNKHKGKYYKAKNEESLIQESDVWPLIEKADIAKDFTFVSYNSVSSKQVWNFCKDNAPPLNNLWIDRKLVSENWMEDVEEALCSSTCKKAILFINKDYLVRSTACYQEAKLIVENQVPHIIALIDMDASFALRIIDDWIHTDAADKEKLRLFKSLFHYDDDTGHFNGSVFSLSETTKDRLLQAYSNLHKKEAE